MWSHADASYHQNASRSEGLQENLKCEIPSKCIGCRFHCRLMCGNLDLAFPSLSRSRGGYLPRRLPLPVTTPRAARGRRRQPQVRARAPRGLGVCRGGGGVGGKRHAPGGRGACGSPRWRGERRAPAAVRDARCAVNLAARRRQRERERMRSHGRVQTCAARALRVDDRLTPLLCLRARPPPRPRARGAAHRRHGQPDVAHAAARAAGAALAGAAEVPGAGGDQQDHRDLLCA